MTIPDSSELTPSLISQAQTILEAATSLQQQLDSAALRQPSFAPSGRRNWFDAGHLPQLLETRLKLLDTAQSMLDLVMGPMDTVSYLAGPLATKLEVFRTLDKLKVAEHVPLDGDISIIDLAHNMCVDADILERHLRCAYLMGMFRESKRGYVAYTGVSAEIPNSPYNQPRLSEMFTKGSFHVPEAMKVSSDNTKPTMLVPIELADRDRAGRNFWRQLALDDPEGKGMEKFSAGMRRLGLALFGGDYSIFIRAFDWDNIEKGKLIDVGGGNGHIEVNIAKHLPDVPFIIQDLELNTQPARRNIGQHGLQDRVQFQPHDFF